MCGIGMGRCNDGYCCSRYGWCGKSDEYCNIKKGCQFEFGTCNLSDNSVSKDGRCGEGIGNCKEDYCCSKSGWCGKSKKYCDRDQGCQLSYGRCNSIRNYEGTNFCGEGIGHCKEGYCCSKEGWCELSSKSCNIDNGCQPEYGNCNIPEKLSSKYSRFGKDIGSCKEGYCCSKYGWCGKSNKHCNVEEGCQSEFGKCHFVQGRCGKNIGSCKKGECCSKYGWCGKSSDHCSVNKGCQFEYGECHSQRSSITKTSTKTKNSTKKNTKTHKNKHSYKKLSKIEKIKTHKN